MQPMTPPSRSIGTKAALQNPACDPETGRIRFPTLAAPQCVKPWKDGADNGGATAQGVTKDSIKVVVLYVDVVQDDRSPASLYKNQATGGFSNQRDTIVDADAVYAHAFETWGRKVEYVFVKGSGADETAQRAAELCLRADDRLEPLVVPGLLDEVARATAHRLDGDVDRAPRGHDHDRQHLVSTVNLGQQLETFLA